MHFPRSQTLESELLVRDALLPLQICFAVFEGAAFLFVFVFAFLESLRFSAFVLASEISDDLSRLSREARSIALTHLMHSANFEWYVSGWRGHCT